MKTYLETFDNGPGGWYGWGFEGAMPLPCADGAVTSRGPWWVDYNHAPPGGGYLHLLYVLNTRVNDHVEAVSGPSRFLEGNYGIDFTDARITVRLRGDLAARGAQVVLLVQSDVTEPAATRVNSVLWKQPLAVTPDWTEQTLVCAPDNDQWLCLGSRHDRFATYGWGPIAPVLRTVTCDIIFVLFPLDVQPAVPLTEDRHLLRAGRDYPIQTDRLPAGQVEMDTIRIEFPHAS